MSDLSLAPGALIAGRYRLERHLGEGGMAIVWKATHVVTQRAVAMKFLREALRGKEELRVRFHREASAASALHHPNVVEILDVFDYEEGAPVMVMELLEGETLGEKLERDEKLSLEETAALLLPVVSAVGAAHALGIVHRDLKPENVFLVSTPGVAQVKVLDFGIAKVMSGMNARAMHTEAGSMLGTPCYMAPEQASGNAVDHRADIWSLGVILYECLSGTRPIEGDDLMQVVTRLASAAIMPLERLAPELPHDVAAIVMQMLSRDPARRPSDLLAVSKLLSTYTRAVVPAFGPASTGKAWAPSSEEIAKVKVVQGRSADPRGPTLLSSPPVPSSVTVVADETGARAPLPGPLLLSIGLGGLVLVGLTVGVQRSWRSNGDTSPPRSSVERAHDVAVTVPALAASSAVPSSLPAPSSALSATPKNAARRPKAPGRPATMGARPASSGPDAAASAGAKSAKDEGTLFSGRK